LLRANVSQTVRGGRRDEGPSVKRKDNWGEGRKEDNPLYRQKTPKEKRRKRLRKREKEI